MTQARMTCQELVELVTDYFEDALSAEERTRFEAHLGGCSGCNVYIQQMRKTLELMGKLTADYLSDPARDELMSVFRQWKQEK
jgi:anti-sigma factor RsiW